VIANKLAYRFGFGRVERGDMVIFDDMNFKFDRSNKLRSLWQKYFGMPIPFIPATAGPINVTKRVIAIPGDIIEGRVEDGKPVIYLNGAKLDESYLNPYPLILLRKTAGFLPFDSIGPIPIPSFLKKQVVRGGVYYAYDPDKHFDEQPYFQMKPNEVVVLPDYPELTFRLPDTPTYKNDLEKAHCVDIFGPMRVPEDKYWVMGDNRKDSMDSRWFGFLDADRIHGRMSRIFFSIDSEEPFWFFELLKHPIDFWIKSIRWNRFFASPTTINRTKMEVKEYNRLSLLRGVAKEALREINVTL